MEDAITYAITNLYTIAFTYNGLKRICEPHVLGMANRQKQLLCYQTAGSSKRGGIPQWRRFDLLGMKDIEVTNDKFSGPRPIPSGFHSIWDSVILTVG